MPYKDRNKHLQVCRNWRERNPAYRRERHLRDKYGISTEVYDRMFEEQGGACGMCFRTGQKLVVDHDHATGRVRRLLCNYCNSRLPVIEHPGFREMAVAYLRQFGWTPA